MAEPERPKKGKIKTDSLKSENWSKVPCALVRIRGPRWEGHDYLKRPLSELMNIWNIFPESVGHYIHNWFCHPAIVSAGGEFKILLNKNHTTQPLELKTQYQGDNALQNQPIL